MKRVAYIILGTPSEASYLEVPYFKIKDGDRLYSALEGLQGAKLTIRGIGNLRVRRIIYEPFPKAETVILSLYCEEVVDFDDFV